MPTVSNFSTTNIILSTNPQGNLDSGDITQPYSFQDWLKRNETTLPTKYIADYNLYLQGWYAGQKSIVNQTVITNNLKQIYKDFLRSVALSFKDSEETRLFTNINFDDDFELASIIPLIARKLKAIAAYYASKRESAKATKLKYNMTGTNEAIERILYQYILRSFTKYPYNYTVNDQTLTLAFSALSAIQNDFQIQIEELYDVSSYFDSTSNLPISAYTDFTQTSNFLAFANFATALLQALHETRFYDTTPYSDIQSDLTLIYQLLSTNTTLNASNTPGYNSNLTYPLSTFIDYVSGSQIVDYYEPAVAAKYLGTDYYAVSTDNLGNPVLSGKYLNAIAPYTCLDNLIYPTIATVPNYSGLQTIEQLGGYHIPSKIGTLNYTALSPIPVYSTDTLLPNNVYFIPNPNVYTSIRGLSLSGHFSPIIHLFELDWFKQMQTNSYSEGCILDARDIPIFKSYQSKYETRKFDANGVQRVDDNYDFWTGPTDSTWSRPDLYPLNFRGEFNIDKRTTTLLNLSGEKIFNWSTDIFGNHYTLYKNVVLSSGDYKSIYDRYHNTTGNLWIRTVYDNILSDETALSAIYLKYITNNSLYSQLSSSQIQNFDVIYNTLIIELSSYILFEQISFDYVSNTFKNTNTTSKVFHLSASNILFGGYWFNEEDKNITICTCTSSTSAGFDYIYPDLYQLNIDSFLMKRVYSGFNDDTLLFPSGINLSSLDSPILTYNKDTDAFNVSTLAKDLNNKCYIISIQIGKNQLT
jgi:hypothetical protein